MTCVCGHHKDSHYPVDMGGCIGNRNLCHCGIYEPDDGTDGRVDHSCEGVGIYRTNGLALDEHDDL